MKRLILAFCLCFFVGTMISCGASEKGAQSSTAEDKATAEAKYAELLRRQNEFVQSKGGS
jgi:hypothetical protein